jgi:Spy/CpxP family protein refolding chaperone
MKKVYVVLVAVFFVALSTTAFAFGPGFGPMDRGGCGMYQAYARGFGAGLNLSKNQLDKMWELGEKHRTDTQATRREMFQKNMELRTMYTDPKADDAAILAKQKEVNALRQKLQDKMWNSTRTEKGFYP